MQIHIVYFFVINRQSVSLETRKTYRAVLSEPKVIFPSASEELALESDAKDMDGPLKRVRVESGPSTLSETAAKKKKKK